MFCDLYNNKTYHIELWFTALLFFKFYVGVLTKCVSASVILLIFKFFPVF